MRYEKNLELEHFHEPGKGYMSMRDRAGQFAPYKALDGYEDIIGRKVFENLNSVWEDIDFSESQENIE